MIEYKLPHTAFFWPKMLSQVRQYVRNICSPTGEPYWNEHLKQLREGKKPDNLFELTDSSVIGDNKEQYLISVTIRIRKTK